MFCWSQACRSDRYVPSSKARSTAAYVLGFFRSPAVNSGNSRYDSSEVEVTTTSTSYTLSYAYPRPVAVWLPEYCNARKPVNPAFGFIVGPLTGPELTNAFMSEAGGGVVSPLDSCHSESWMRLSPLLAVTSSR